MGGYIYNTRPAYTDAEISQLIRKKMKDEKISKDDLYKKYTAKYEDLDISTIEYMIAGNVFFNETMISIASDYIEISIDALLGVIEDEDEISCRGNSDDDISHLCETVNILFSEMINQIKLSGKNL